MPLFEEGRIPAGVYTGHEGIFETTASLHRNVSGFVEVRYGDFFSGQRLRVWTRIDWRPNRFGRIGFEYDHNELWIDLERDLGPSGAPTGTKIVDARIRSRVARIRLNVQFTPDISWLTFVQYDNVSDQVGVNSRLRWMVEDGREIFIVFNQTLLALDGDIRNGVTEPLAKVGWTLRF